MALDEIRNIPLLLLYYFNIILTYGLEDVIVDYNDILQIMAWMPFWLSKIFFSSYKSFLLLSIFGELYYLLNQIHQILQYVVIVKWTVYGISEECKYMTNYINER